MNSGASYEAYVQVDEKNQLNGHQATSNVYIHLKDELFRVHREEEELKTPYHREDIEAALKEIEDLADQTPATSNFHQCKNNTELKSILLSKDVDTSFSSSNSSTNILHSLFLPHRDNFHKALNLSLKQKYNISQDLIFLKQIGKGAFGRVRKVFDKQNRQFLAYKKLINRHRNFNDYMAKLEYKALLTILEHDSPKLLRVLQLDHRSGVKFSVLMECGQGSLKDFLIYVKNTSEKWSTNDLLELYHQLVDQINELKKISLCHRDIKPANIIITSEGKFKLTYYGVSEIIKEEGPQLMVVRGTERYMHPVLLAARKQNLRYCMIDPFEADLYAIKTTINELIEVDGGTTSIDTLLAQNPNFVTKGSCELYERLKGDYNGHLFDKIYGRLPMEEKYKYMHVFIDYFTWKEIVRWLQKKLKEVITRQLARLVYFFAAEVLKINAKYSEAMKFYRKCEKQSRGQNDNHTALLYSSMARIEFNREQYISALSYYEKSLSLNKKNFGEQSVEVTQSYSELALLKCYQDKPKQALEYCKKALQYCRNYEGKINSDLLVIFRGVGSAMCTLGLYKDSLYFLLRSLENAKRTLGKKHPGIALYLLMVGAHYWFLAKFEDSIEPYNQAKKIFKESLDVEHSNIAICWLNLGDSYKECCNFQKALECYENGLKLFEQKYPEHGHIYDIKSGMAEIWLRKKDEKHYQKAEKYLLENLDHLKQVHKSSPYEYGVLFKNLGLLHLQKNELDQALKYYGQSVKYFRKLLAENFQLASVYKQIGLIYIKLSKYEKGRGVLEKALGIIRTILSPEHNLLPLWFYEIGQVYYEQGLAAKNKRLYSNEQTFNEEALSWFLRCLEVKPQSSKIYNTSHYMEGVKDYIHKISVAKRSLNEEFYEEELANESVSWPFSNEVAHNSECLNQNLSRCFQKKAVSSGQSLSRDLDKHSINQASFNEEVFNQGIL